MPKMTERPKHIIVAGGAGFLGSHLCERLLAEGHYVICVDSFVSGDKANLKHLSRKMRFRSIAHDICSDLEIDGQIDQIYNLACQASPPRYQQDPTHTLMTSVIGTDKLLKLASKHSARFLQASTSEVYGDPQQHPQKEDYWGNVNCTGPRACYDEGKRAAETLCFDRLRRGEADARIARIFNTYGPRMRPDDGRIVSNFILQALRGEPLTIYGDGSQTRSFCFVDDLVDGLVRLMNHPENPGLPVNLGNPGEYTVREVAEKVAELTATELNLEDRPLPVDDPQRRRPDIGRALSLLGWRPVTELSDGLKQTIDWFRGGAPVLPMHASGAGRSPAPALSANAERR
ncbi:UDP-glucuronic acid decarboxylase family protein [Martelella sp. FOR1707]